jgi:23S rRNA (guanosine2251-2'-O)-methyltransferase
VVFILQHGKEHQIFGIRAIIEAIKQDYSRQSLYSKDASSELMKDLMKVMKRANINFYVPVEKN